MNSRCQRQNYMFATRPQKFSGIAMLAAMLVGTPVEAQQTRSVYTTFDAKTCMHERGNAAVEDYGSWSCPGYGGRRVLLSAGDQRMYVSFGRSKDDIALSQTFPGFNDVYEGKVEWLIDTDADGRSRPFATILRWNVMTGRDLEGAKGPVKPTDRVLVVTRLGPGGVCHVGYVDAGANPDANDLARQIADQHARNFRCGKDKRIVLGTTNPDLSLPKDNE